jgi:ankyrin repeat protein
MRERLAGNIRVKALCLPSAFNGQGAIVQLLLQRDNIDPNRQSDGLTPLMFAVWSGHEAVVPHIYGMRIDSDSSQRCKSSNATTDEGEDLSEECHKNPTKSEPILCFVS